LFRNPIISAAGYDKPQAEAQLKSGNADLVGFGRRSSPTRICLTACNTGWR
jgi:2,4-dienoyl-CoA reductase-like NADH-dependent reductase (Old Yellow Enzyme family)